MENVNFHDFQIDRELTPDDPGRLALRAQGFELQPCRR
jgi:hypothetical protein